MISSHTTTRDREEIIRGACSSLSKELYLIEPIAYCLFFQLGQMPQVFDQVNQMVERNFRVGTMHFSCTGDTLIDWECNSTVAIDLEFTSEEIFAFFRLVLGGKQPVVDLHHIAFPNGERTPEENNVLLRDALKRAQICKPPSTSFTQDTSHSL